MSRERKLGGLWEYPFPLADGKVGYLYLPPTLPAPDANRLKMMIDSLVPASEGDE